MKDTKKDMEYMDRCLELALKGLGTTAPNPMVGCVLVADGRIIGQGYHREYGKSHAEVNAIQSVKNEELLVSSTLYVNLEPCSHHGKTPPCSELILDKGIPRVIVGTFKGARCFHDSIVGSQGFKFVGCCDERVLSQACYFFSHQVCITFWCIDPGSYGSPAQGKFSKVRKGVFYSLQSMIQL